MTEKRGVPNFLFLLLVEMMLFRNLVNLIRLLNVMPLQKNMFMQISVTVFPNMYLGISYTIVKRYAI